jgi:4-diphosphocytidyl-2-C-methyl-D-erythritol kinase
MKSLQIQALAKINLDLRILHKRPDGYHDLRTVFQTISLADQIQIDFEPARRTQISLDGNPEIADNLILRAAQAILDATRTGARIHFKLTKKIPMGAGLGGGSSDAAAILLALPILIGKPIDAQKLAADLGSDVPFFLDGGAALALGRGEELYPLPDLAEEPILIATSGIHVATGPAYAALGRGLTFTGSSRKIGDFQGYVRALSEGGRATSACALSVNDFEPVVFRGHPQLKAIVRKLSKSGAAGVRMTGSGSAIVAFFDSIARRERARKALAGDSGIVAANLVSRRSYRKLWRRALRDHIVPVVEKRDDLWPPRSRYER